MSKIKRRLMTLLITLGIIVAVLFGVGYLILPQPFFRSAPLGCATGAHPALTELS